MRALFVGLVVTDHYDGGGHTDHDTPSVIEALFREGITAVPTVWHDERTDWSSFDAIVIRSPWDYSNRSSEFDDWLQRVAMQTRVFNNPELIRWNLNKRYLDELHSCGIPIIQTSYCTDLREVITSVHSLSSSWQVIKPSISAGSRNTGLFRKEDDALFGLAQRILDAGKEVMIQPEVASLSAGREKALFYFGGRFSHAITKGALLARGGGFLSGSYQETPRSARAETEELALGDLSMAAIREMSRRHEWASDGANPPVYARFDVVIDEQQGPLLIEAELFEPSLYVHDNPQAARQYAKAVADQLVRVSP